MLAKTIFMLCLFFAPLVLISTGIVESTLLLFALYVTAGLGMTGVGMGIMHDAIHGSYSKKQKINKLLGYTFNLIGGNASVWKVQHNVLHHTYTNIEHSDDDLNAPFFLRFSPHAKKYWVHQFQHLYIWFFYGLATISWITTKDYVRLKRYKNMGFFDGKNEYRNSIISITAWKLFYYSYALVLPLIMAPQAWWIIVLAFLSMHFVTGIFISTVFQVAHIMPDVDFPLPNSNNQISEDWYKHQFATTSNFSPRSSLFSWFIGGLNYQVEHHLLPNVCHIHYKKLSSIVADTAKEYGMPYHSKRTFISAIWHHAKMLRELGRVPELVPVSAE